MILTVLFKKFLARQVERKKAELIDIQVQISNKLENMHYARYTMMEDRADYLYTDLTILWKQQRKHKRFIKLFQAA